MFSIDISQLYRELYKLQHAWRREEVNNENINMQRKQQNENILWPIVLYVRAYISHDVAIFFPAI